MCWLCCRLRGAQMLHVLVVLQVTWRSDATCVGCVAGVTWRSDDTCVGCVAGYMALR